MIFENVTPFRLTLIEDDSPRLVLCEACGSEGRIYEGYGNDPHPRDCGPCPWCEGTGGELVATQPVELKDLEPLIPADAPPALATAKRGHDD